MANFLVLFLWSLTSFFFNAETIDLGTFGPVFSVEEENMITVLKRRLQLYEEAGKLEDLKRQWQSKIKDGFKTPKSVEGVQNTVQERSFHHDPSLIVEHDIKTPKGDVLAKKGDLYNPLTVMKPEKGFLFIRGTEEDHMILAQKNCDQFDIVLFEGSPIDLEKKLKVPVFFDQGGYLTKHYGIRQVPAFLSEDHNLLLIREVKP